MKLLFNSLSRESLNKRLYLLASLLLAIGLGFIPLFNIAQAGLGVSPGTLILDDVRPGTEIFRDIFFSRGDASREQILSIKIEGPAADSLSGPDELVLPVGQNNVPYPLLISTGTLGTGTYEASVTGTETLIKRNSGEMGDTNGTVAEAAITIGAKASILFTVTNDILQEFIIKQAIMRASEEEQVLGFSYYLINTGNVDARPSKIDLVITDQSDPTNVYRETIDGNTLAPTKAFSEKEVVLATKAKLKAGRYWVDIVFYAEDEVIFTRSQLALQIFPPGTLDQRGELKEFTLDKLEYEQNELIVFTGVFRNEGEIGLLAEFVVDLVRRDGKGDVRVDLLKSEPIFIPANKTANFSLTKRLEQGGTYTANGFVNFGIYNSNEIEVDFEVKGLNILLVIAILVVLSVILGAIVWWIRERRSNKDNLTVNKSHTKS